MEIADAKFGLDEQLHPAFYAKVKVGVNEDSSAGKFGITFGVAEAEKTGKMLVAIVEGKVIAVAHPVLAVDWVKAVIKEKRYHWFHLYYSDVEKIGDDNLCAVRIPTDTNGWLDIPDIPQWEQMLKILENQ